MRLEGQEAGKIEGKKVRRLEDWEERRLKAGKIEKKLKLSRMKN